MSVNFILEWQNLLFKVNSVWQIFYKLFAFKDEVGKVAEENFFRISFYWRHLTRCLNHEITAYKPTHYRLDCGDLSSTDCNRLNAAIIFLSKHRFFFKPLTMQHFKINNRQDTNRMVNNYSIYSSKVDPFAINPEVIHCMLSKHCNEIKALKKKLLFLSKNLYF